MRMSTRAAGYTAFAGVVPFAVSLALSRMTLFSIYDGFDAEFWLICFVFFMPTLFLLIVYVLFRRSRRNREKVSRSGPHRIFGDVSHRVMLLLSLIYIVFMVYRYILIGAVLEYGITGARYEEIRLGPGIGGIYTAITIFTSAAPAFLFLSTIENHARNRKLPLLALFVALVGLGVSFLSGGRNTFLVNIGFMSCAALINPDLSTRRALRGFAASRWFARTLIRVSLLLGFGLALSFFVDRALLRSDDLLDRAALHAFENGLGFDRNRIPSVVPAEIYIVLFYIHAYLTIPLHYLEVLVSHGLPNGPLWGGYNFYVYTLILDRVFGSGFSPDLANALPFVGAYYTLPGSIYVDFGMIGLVVASFLIPLGTASCINAYWRGRPNFMFPGTLMLTILLFSPLYNAITVGPGSSLLLFCGLFMVFGNKRLRFGAGRGPGRKPVASC